MSEQDEPNPVLRLAKKQARWCYLASPGLHAVCPKKCPTKANNSLIDQACLIRMAGCWAPFFGKFSQHCCILFLGKTFNSHSAFPQPGMQMHPSNYNEGPMGERGTSRKIGWGCAPCFPNPLLYLHVWAKSVIFPTLFMTRPSLYVVVFMPVDALNILFIKNDEKVASSRKRTKFKNRVQKSYPI